MDVERYLNVLIFLAIAVPIAFVIEIFIKGMDRMTRSERTIRLYNWTIYISYLLIVMILVLSDTQENVAIVLANNYFVIGLVLVSILKNLEASIAIKWSMDNKGRYNWEGVAYGYDHFEYPQKRHSIFTLLAVRLILIALPWLSLIG